MGSLEHFNPLDILKTEQLTNITNQHIDKHTYHHSYRDIAEIKYMHN